MKTVKFYTLGCKVNLYETEAIRGLFEKEGFIESDSDVADVYVINTCTVTAAGDKKSRQIIRRTKRLNPNSIVAVIGCYAQVSADKVRGLPQADIIVGTNDKSRVVSYVKQFCGTRIDALTEDIKPFFDDFSSVGQHRTRAMLKIQDGCENFCTYCIIPYARGPIRSRSIQSAAAEAKALARKGFTEIVLVGIHLSSYGRDIGASLTDVIGAVCKTEGIKRVRLGSLEPKIITHDFVKSISLFEQICPSFHITMQSGCNETLRRMKRRYTAEEYLSSLSVLRRYFPDCAVSTDVMVGFPGESDKEFQTSVSTIKKARFASLHVFQYSKRDGTPAAQMSCQVDDNVKAKRSRKLIELGEQMQQEYNERFIGKTLPVLFETDKQGFTPNYIKVCVDSGGLAGAYKNVTIEKCGKGKCFGTIK